MVKRLFRTDSGRSPYLSKKIRPETSPIARRGRYVSTVPRAIATRGTPTGYYEFERTVWLDLSYGANGFSVSGSNYTAISFVFSPVNLEVYGDNLVFQTEALPGAAEFAALFELMKIQSVEMTILPRSETSASNQNSNNPVFWICSDPNSGQTATSLDRIQQASDCQVFNANGNAGTFRKIVYPSFQNVVYYTSLTSSYSAKRGYVNADTAIPHYGIHVGGTFNTVGRVAFSFKYKMRCKNLK